MVNTFTCNIYCSFIQIILLDHLLFASNCFGETHFFIRSQILIKSLIELLVLLNCIPILKVQKKVYADWMQNM